MGNNVSSIGDVFFSDNPDRRRRANELNSQISIYQVEFQALSNSKNVILNRIRPKLDQVLRDRGFNSSADLEQKVKETLNTEELRKYDELRGLINHYNEAESIAWDVIGLVGVSSGIVIGGAFLIGVISSAAAIAALEIVGGILAAVALVIVVIGVVEGAIERDQLRAAIRDLFPQRALMKQYLEQMRAIANWATTLEVWLNNPTTSDPEIMNKLLAGTLDSDYRSWTLQRVEAVLAEQDYRDGSWTNEDPGHFFAAGVDADYAAEEKWPKKSFRVVPSSSTKEGEESKPWLTTFQYQQIQSLTSCIVSSGDKLWRMEARPTNLLNPALETTLFDLIELVEKSGRDSEGPAIQLGACTLQLMK